MAIENGVAGVKELRDSCAHCSLSLSCLPSAIGNHDLALLDDMAKRRRPLERGDYLFREGDRHSALFVVRSGAIKVSTLFAEGGTQVLGFHLPGEILGLDGVAEDRHKATAEALEDSSVCEIPFARLSQIAAQVPALQREVYRIVSREFVREQRHPVMMGRKHALTRLALFLHSVAERRRLQELDPAHFQLSMSRQDLANYLGLVIETVSRAFSRLQALGVIRVDRRLVQVLDAAALEQIANREDGEARA